MNILLTATLSNPVTDSTLMVTSIKLPDSLFNDANTYYWRVKAKTQKAGENSVRYTHLTPISQVLLKE
ncbi:MAG: hypothetical protein HC906_15950 [Bacteroidales bacterium]|nr:hypothetical protein [Bacteroidales bacterium]